MLSRLHLSFIKFSVPKPRWCKYTLPQLHILNTVKNCDKMCRMHMWHIVFQVFCLWQQALSEEPFHDIFVLSSPSVSVANVFGRSSQHCLYSMQKKPYLLSLFHSSHGDCMIPFLLIPSTNTYLLSETNPDIIISNVKNLKNLGKVCT